MFLVPQQPVNVFITISAFILGAAQLIFLVNFFVSIFAGKRATERNPWHATTLEWTAPSPPGHDRRRRAARQGGAVDRTVERALRGGHHHWPVHRLRRLRGHLSPWS